MPKISNSPRRVPAWYVQIAEVMVRNNVSLKEAALELKIQLDPDEVLRIGRMLEFQEILRVEGNKWHAAIANDPTRTKSTAIGRMWALANKLEKEGEFERAANVIDKVAKMEGWAGNEGNVNIFSGLTARDIAEARAKLQGFREESPKRAEAREINQPATRTESLPN